MADPHWPAGADALADEQRRLAGLTPDPWTPSPSALVGACFVCFPTGISGTGAEGDPAWAAATLGPRHGEVREAVVEGVAGAPYEPGLMALREGPALEMAVRALPRRPDLLLVNAAGRDHPRRAGLALHLGAVLDVPTVGVTHRAFVATGGWPPDEAGASTPLLLDGDPVGAWVRVRRGRRPLVAHAAWCTDPATAIDVVLRACEKVRTPEPLRIARRAARKARARAEGRAPPGA